METFSLINQITSPLSIRGVALLIRDGKHRLPQKEFSRHNLLHWSIDFAGCWLVLRSTKVWTFFTLLTEMPHLHQHIIHTNKQFTFCATQHQLKLYKICRSAEQVMSAKFTRPFVREVLIISDQQAPPQEGYGLMAFGLWGLYNTWTLDWTVLDCGLDSGLTAFSSVHWRKMS